MTIPTTVEEAFQYPQRETAIDEEMQALVKNQTWEVVKLKKGIKPVGVRWVFNVKYNLYAVIGRYKTRL